ncbi:MAG: energy transducer TonB [Rhodocyclaceae bacterium]|nr:energy transducer TonB [Rhodocyclaceae bacterium]MBX3668698.1 energy transducer TonB [Rhodocyclaceae bacterium]
MAHTRRATRTRPPLTMPVVAGSSWLAVALTVSVFLHALILSLQFKQPNPSRLKREDRQLEVVLVNAKHKHKPKDAQVLAQANLDAGGDVDAPRVAKTPVTPTRQARQGEDLIQAERRVQELEARQRDLLRKAQSSAPPVRAEPPRQEQPTAEAATGGSDLAERSLAMARLEAQIARNLDEYNRRPRKKMIGSRAEEYAFTQYVEEWRQKVERYGSRFYPDAARGKLYGSVRITVEIDSAGEVIKVEINQPSGERVLDDAAVKIVKQAAPYGRFSPAIRAKGIDILSITRTITFTRSDQFAAE